MNIYSEIGRVVGAVTLVAFLVLMTTQSEIVARACLVWLKAMAVIVPAAIVTALVLS